MTLPVAILAGGLATRLKPITAAIPKSLVDVGGKPFAVRQIELLKSHGLRRFVFCVAHLGEMVRETLGDGTAFGVDIRYVFDGPVLLGTGGALRRALPELGDAFFVLYGDSYLQCDYRAAQKAFVDSGQQGLMTVLHNAGKWDRSNVLFHDGRIVAYDKSLDTVGMQHIDYGLGALKADVFDDYPVDEPIDLATIYQGLLVNDQLAAYEVNSRFYEIGSHSGLQETRELLAERDTL